MSGKLEQAAPFIGIAIVLDMLDGRIARLTNTTSAFGVEFDSLADVISFGVAPAVLAFEWGLNGLGQVGWAAGFIYMSAAAMRLARFNIQTSAQVDKRYFIGMPTPAAAGLVAATIYASPVLPEGHEQAIAAVAVMMVPAALMVTRSASAASRRSISAEAVVRAAVDLHSLCRLRRHRSAHLAVHPRLRLPAVRVRRDDRHGVRARRDGRRAAGL
jgi:CDP-diacylglycerol--serine O-phosphatidyltransferase